MPKTGPKRPKNNFMNAARTVHLGFNGSKRLRREASSDDLWATLPPRYYPSDHPPLLDAAMFWAGGDLIRE